MHRKVTESDRVELIQNPIRQLRRNRVGKRSNHKGRPYLNAEKKNATSGNFLNLANSLTLMHLIQITNPVEPNLALAINEMFR